MFQKLDSKSFNSFIKLAFSSLSKNHLNLLNSISLSKKTASKFAKESNLPISTTWHNLRKLREINLISFGNQSKIKITKLGKIILTLSSDSSMVEQLAVAHQAVSSNPAHEINKLGRLKDGRRKNS